METTGKTVEFRFARGLSLRSRMAWITALVGLGLIIQLTLSVFLGWVLFLIGCIFGIIRGRSTKPSVSSNGEWKTTTIEELENIDKLSAQIRAWRGRTNGFRATSGSGCGMVLLYLIGLIISTVIIGYVVDGQVFQPGRDPIGQPPIRGGAFFPIWLFDGLTLLIPIWFAGGIYAWEPPKLEQKTEYLMAIYALKKNRPELEFSPSLFVTGPEEHIVPTDCRLLVRFKDAPKEFIGVQVQVSMNDVQGTKYPYCYSVIIAKKEFGLAEKAKVYLSKPSEPNGFLALFKSDSNEKKERKFKRFRECIAEVNSEQDVDVVVVRQATVGKGYYTTVQQAEIVFGNALALAQFIVKGVPPEVAK